MKNKRLPRLNSLLKEVIAEVIQREVKNPKVAPITSVTRVDISKDLHHATVYVSVLGDQSTKEETLQALTSAAGFIGTLASKKITIRYFPSLHFSLDDSLDKQLRIEELLEEIHVEQARRHKTLPPGEAPFEEQDSSHGT